MRHDRLRRWLDTAERHTRAGRLRRAAVFYRKVLGQARAGEFEHELAHARLGDLHLGQGRADLALPHLQRARALADEPEYALMTGRALSALGRHDEAAGALFDAVESPPHTTDALVELARVSGARGDRSTARRLAHLAGRRDRAHRRLSRAFADA